MDKVCAICFDDMDMLSYQDERESTPTSFKLNCGHAFHTKCIVECLQKMNHKCPQCNSRKSPQQSLTMEGLVGEAFDEIRKTKDVREEIAKYKTSKKELEQTIKTIKKDVKDFVEKRKVELNFKEKKKNFGLSMRSVKLKFAKICKKKGPLYAGAYTNTTEWKRTKLIFPDACHLHRRRYPYIFIRL